MKTKVMKKKAVKKAVKKPVERDTFGFRKGTKSSQAVKMLASGKTSMKDVRKKFSTLSFGKLLKAVEAHGFKMEQNGQGKCSITGQMKLGVGQ